MEGISATKLPEIEHPLESELPQNEPSFDFNQYLRSQTQIGRLGHYVIDNPCDEGLQRREQLWSYLQNHRGAATKAKVNRESPAFRFTQPETNDVDKVKKKSKRNGGSENKKVIARLRLRTTKMDPKSSTVFPSDLEVSDRSQSSPSQRTEYKLNALHRNFEKESRDEPSVSQMEKYIKQNLSYSAEKLPDLTSALTKLGYMRFTKNVVHYGGGFFGRHGDLSRSWTTLCNSESSKLSGTVLSHVLENKRYGSFRKLDFLRGVPAKGETFPKTNSQKRDELLSCLKKTPIDTEKTRLKMILQNELLKKRADDKKRKSAGIDTEIRKLSKTRKDLNNNYSADYETKNNVRVRENARAKQLISDIVKPLGNTVLKSSNSGIVKHSGNNDPVKSSGNMLVKPSNKNVQAETGSERVRMTGGEYDAHLRREKSDMSIDMPIDRFGPSTHSRYSSHIGHSDNGVNPFHWNKKSFISENDKQWIKKTLEDSNIIDQTNYGGFARTKPVQLPKITDPRKI